GNLSTSQTHAKSIKGSNRLQQILLLLYSYMKCHHILLFLCVCFYLLELQFSLNYNMNRNFDLGHIYLVRGGGGGGGAILHLLFLHFDDILCVRTGDDVFCSAQLYF
ncbi:hypothetical protein ACJX0J_039322, partial [Zea mays]